VSSVEVYSADNALEHPRRFFASAVADLAVVPHASWRLFVRMVQARYRQSVLRWVWLITPPLVMTLTWVFLAAAGVIKHANIGLPYAAYVGSGTVIWQTLLDSLNAPSQSLARATQVLKSARLPHEAWIVAGVLDALVNLAVRSALLMILLAALGTLGGFTLLLVPLALAGVMLLGLGIGLFVAVFGRLYTDVGSGLTVLTTLWLFGTPVFYRLPSHGTVRSIIELNPLTAMVLTARAWLTGTQGAEPVKFAIVTLVAVLVTIAGWLLYRVAQPHLVERM
jgi:lipopolysaccharide transport system permease protein